MSHVETKNTPSVHLQGFLGDAQIDPTLQLYVHYNLQGLLYTISELRVLMIL